MFQGIKSDLSGKIVTEVQDLAMQVGHSKKSMDHTISIVKDLFNDFSILADAFMVNYLLNL